MEPFGCESDTLKGYLTENITEKNINVAYFQVEGVFLFFTPNFWKLSTKTLTVELITICL